MQTKIKTVLFILPVCTFLMEFQGIIETNQRTHLRIRERFLFGGLRFTEQQLVYKKPNYSLQIKAAVSSHSTVKRVIWNSVDCFM